MMRNLKKFFLAFVGALMIASGSFAVEKSNDGWVDGKSEVTVQTVLESEFNTTLKNNSQFDANSMMKTNLSCGLRPLPPLGCSNPVCMCDQNGRNCQWIFQCR